MSNIKVPRRKLKEFCVRNHIRKLSFFGSVVRDDFTPDSDIDVLVEFDKEHIPGLAFFGMEEELSQMLGRKVDFLTIGFIHKDYRRKVLQEARVLYEAIR